jgi:hypothetical protein
MWFTTFKTARDGAMQSMARISMAEMAGRLRTGTSAIELAIRRKNSEEVG